MYLIISGKRFFLKEELMLRWKALLESMHEVSSFDPNLTKCKTSAAAAKSLQSCPTLCDPIDGSPPDSPVPGILWHAKSTICQLKNISKKRRSQVTESEKQCWKLQHLWPHQSLKIIQQHKIIINWVWYNWNRSFR